MNAPVLRLPAPVHAEHTVLLRDRDPWDVPTRLLQAEAAPDPLQDIRSEEFVLAYMLSNPGRVKTLTSREFTGRDRPVIFEALKEQIEEATLDLLDTRLDCPGYVSELRWQPTLANGALRECVANLKRLSSLRELTEAVDAWRRRCTTMTVAAARVELASVCFPRRGK